MRLWSSSLLSIWLNFLFKLISLTCCCWIKFWFSSILFKFSNYLMCSNQIFWLFSFSISKFSLRIFWYWRFILAYSKLVFPSTLKYFNSFYPILFSEGPLFWTRSSSDSMKLLSLRFGRFTLYRYFSSSN